MSLLCLLFGIGLAICCRLFGVVLSVIWRCFAGYLALFCWLFGVISNRRTPRFGREHSFTGCAG